MQKIIIADDTSTISTRDRGLNYGDGFFTTAKIVAGEVEHWQHHKARLIECAERLGFSAIDFTELEQSIKKRIATLSLNVLKIVITRGEGGRGYALPTHSNLTILISVLDFPTHYSSLANTGISVNISPIKLAAQPLLAGLKTLNRLEQVLIKNAMAKQNCDDVIVLDHQNNVIEASAANIFAIANNTVFTPSLEQCGIKGVYLQSLCDKLAVEFKQVSVLELTQASAVFICNSLMGAVAVNRIEQHTFDVPQSQRLLNELLAKEAKC
ncbi:4-amino-4-deoxychorismate lyase [Pseudoalteromonas espejiana DSM 9414]|uniref:Aminodeoxychorismate lyase n=1 Tax=Pseudoalteromonas espejiana TaxID=28107 RepID=A0A510XSB2_9GAMM|nr:aminodeoxychorismate lyase [Pseudoalteromonas espejiana]ASM49684.1 4-amino-4-deoxychorismate lyase [Pseudoalteromonas espejiana DSM 9414]GEK53521.1 aminodeoxychorismate lyase [Pseudoalteromonas espejiana]